jgi:hypothetical protein
MIKAKGQGKDLRAKFIWKNFCSPKGSAVYVATNSEEDQVSDGAGQEAHCGFSNLRNPQCQ